MIDGDLLALLASFNRFVGVDEGGDFWYND